MYIKHYLHSSSHCSKLPWGNHSTYTGCTRYRKRLPDWFRLLPNVYHLLRLFKCHFPCHCFLSAQIFLFLGVTLIAAGVTGVSLQWEKEWPTVPLSLQVQQSRASNTRFLSFCWTYTKPRCVLRLSPQPVCRQGCHHRLSFLKRCEITDETFFLLLLRARLSWVCLFLVRLFPAL